MHRIRISVVAALLFATAAFAQTKPITHETLFLMKRVGAPLPSPDGKSVVFSVTEPAYDEKEVVSDLWLVPPGATPTPRPAPSPNAAHPDAHSAPDTHPL